MIGSRSLTAEQPVIERDRRLLEEAPARFGDRLFTVITVGSAGAIVALVLLVVAELWNGSAAARHEFGFGFLTSSDWDPVNRAFGVLPYAYGTVVTSIVALLIAAPIGIGTALFLTEISPRWLRTPVGFLVDMLAAIPSVIYGLWALSSLVPFVRERIEPFLEDHFSFIPLFEGPKYGVGLLAAGLVLTIMILPTVTAISRDVLLAIPSGQREAAYALGATRREVIIGVALPAARTGITGALILGLGRALGETMAVTMVIGNRGEINRSLFALGDTMASVIANQFTEASYNLYKSALIEIGLVLFAVTLLMNIGARLLVARLSSGLEPER